MMNDEGLTLHDKGVVVAVGLLNLGLPQSVIAQLGRRIALAWASLNVPWGLGQGITTLGLQRNRGMGAAPFTPCTPCARL